MVLVYIIFSIINENLDHGKKYGVYIECFNRWIYFLFTLVFSFFVSFSCLLFLYNITTLSLPHAQLCVYLYNLDHIQKYCDIQENALKWFLWIFLLKMLTTPSYFTNIYIFLTEILWKKQSSKMSKFRR